MLIEVDIDERKVSEAIRKQIELFEELQLERTNANYWEKEYYKARAKLERLAKLAGGEED